MAVAARCGQIEGTLQHGGPRCSSLTISAFGIRRTIAMGGVANATFPGTSEGELDRLRPPQKLGVEWQAAEFYGRDPLLGPLFAVLSTGTGSVTSLAEGETSEYFPATNINELHFKLLLPRFGIELASQAAVVNRAQIDRIPPYDAVYELDGPVHYRVTRRWRGLLSRLAPNAVKLETCKVKLMELKNLDVKLKPLGQSGGEASFELSMTNKTTESPVRVTWMVWPMPEKFRLSCAGSLALDRAPHDLRISLPREVLAERRWIAVALTEPFHTDAAQAAELPRLQPDIDAMPGQ
jgi:hypothetical protein